MFNQWYYETWEMDNSNNYNDMFFERLGCHFGHDTADWSLGAGMNMKIKDYNFGLDYAYVDYGILRYTHQFGLNFEFL